MQMNADRLQRLQRTHTERMRMNARRRYECIQMHMQPKMQHEWM